MILSQNLFLKILATKLSRSSKSLVPLILKIQLKLEIQFSKQPNFSGSSKSGPFCISLTAVDDSLLSNSVQPKFLTFIIKLSVKCTDHSKVHVSCYKDDSITGQARRQLLILMFLSKTLKQGPTVHIPFLSNQSTIER